MQDSAERPVFVETVTGKGYRFIAPITQTVTIAVLPFENLSGDPAQEYFSDGLTEEIISSLGRIGGSKVRVIARTSTLAYKDSRKTAAEIGSELGAGFLVEGSVRRTEQHLRITAKLIRAADHVHVWGDSYDRSSGDLLAIQQEIGTGIARRVGAQVFHDTKQAARQSILDPDAHDMYLRGRYYWYRRTLESMAKAEQCFQEAIRKDSSFAPAYAGLADTYVLQILIVGANGMDQWKKARLATQAALKLNPKLPEAHTAAAITGFFVAWDWKASERSFIRAIELNPNYAIAHQFYAHLLSNSSRHDEAIAEIQRAREIDPLSPIMYGFESMFLARAERHEEAFAAVQHALTIDPDFFPAHAALGHLQDEAGKPDAALEEYRKAHHLSGATFSS